MPAGRIGAGGGATGERVRDAMRKRSQALQARARAAGCGTGSALPARLAGGRRRRSEGVSQPGGRARTAATGGVIMLVVGAVGVHRRPCACR